MTVSNFMHEIFEAFKAKVLDSSYIPAAPRETLFARITAVYLLNSEREKAQAFLARTSTHSQADIERLIPFSQSVTAWDSLEVCSTAQSADYQYCEYKLRYATAEGEAMKHLHARYKQEADACIFVDQCPPKVRVIGDPVLHRAGVMFPKKATEQEWANLHRQLALAKKLLIETGGAGIAANQCVDAGDLPYQLTIVGVFHQDEEHVSNVGKRYPGVKFPDAMIMINPRIIRSSEQMITFYHGCLSVPGRLRGEIATPETITVEYETLGDEPNTLMTKIITLKGTDAVVLQHELNHILFGKTYMDCGVAALSLDDLQKTAYVLDEESGCRDNHESEADLTANDKLYPVIRIQDQHTYLDQDTLFQALQEGVTTETLQGLRKQTALAVQAAKTSVVENGA